MRRRLRGLIANAVIVCALLVPTAIVLLFTMHIATRSRPTFDVGGSSVWPHLEQEKMFLRVNFPQMDHVPSIYQNTSYPPTLITTHPVHCTGTARGDRRTAFSVESFLACFSVGEVISVRVLRVLRHPGIDRYSRMTLEGFCAFWVMVKLRSFFQRLR